MTMSTLRSRIAGRTLELELLIQRVPAADRRTGMLILSADGLVRCQSRWLLPRRVSARILT